MRKISINFSLTNKLNICATQNVLSFRIEASVKSCQLQLNQFI